MRLFRKKEEKNVCSREHKAYAGSIKVLGSGCAKCQELEKAAQSAVSELGLEFAVEHVTDFAEIAEYGVLSTPALVVKGQVVSYGKVLSSEEIKDILRGYRNEE